MKGWDNYNDNRVLEYRRWDDYIKSLHAKLDDISNNMEEMFYDSSKINEVCTKLMVLVSKNRSYIPENNDENIDIYKRLIKIYNGLHAKEYINYIRENSKKKNNDQFEKRKSNAILYLLEIFEIVNQMLSDNELNPKPIIKGETWWQERLKDKDISDDEKIEIQALREAGMLN